MSKHGSFEKDGLTITLPVDFGEMLYSLWGGDDAYGYEWMIDSARFVAIDLNGRVYASRDDVDDYFIYGYDRDGFDGIIGIDVFTSLEDAKQACKERNHGIKRKIKRYEQDGMHSCHNCKYGEYHDPDSYFEDGKPVNMTCNLCKKSGSEATNDTYVCRYWESK